MSSQLSVLLIEDGSRDCESSRLVFRKTGPDVMLNTEQNAVATLELLRNRRAPSILLLDRHLPNQHDGDGFLKQLRSGSRFVAIPVVVFTTSDDWSDLSTAYRNGYVVKRDTFHGLVRCIDDLCRDWLFRNRTPYLAGIPC